MRRARVTGALVAAVALMASAVPAAEAKKGGGTVNITRTPNAPVPDRGPGATDPFGHVATTIEVGNKFKGKRIRDVDVTVQTAGATGTLPTNDLDMYLTAPNGATVHLVNNLFGPSPGAPVSIGPLTLDDESPLLLGRGPPENPTELYAPYSGSARPVQGALAELDNGRVKGTWTLEVTDNNDGETSVLSSWTLNVDTGKPYVAEKGKKFKATKTLNAAIPDRAPGPNSVPVGVLTSTLTAGKAFKGKRIRDVNVTVQTAGTTGAAPANDLAAYLIAPNGAIAHQLLQGLGSAPTAVSIGPLTLDDEAPLRFTGVPPGLIPGTLGVPWMGFAEPTGALSVMDDGRVKGTWTLVVLDGDNTETSNLVSWSLEVQTGSPYRSR